MFFRKPEDTRPATVIGPTGTFEGTLRSDDDVLIEGRFVGTLESKGTISVGPEGSIDGDVEASAVVVAGRIDGTVIARRQLHMKTGGRIRGDAKYGAMQVDQGGVIDGRATRLEEVPNLTPSENLPMLPMIVAPPPTPVAPSVPSSVPPPRSKIPPQLTQTAVMGALPPLPKLPNVGDEPAKA